MILPEGKAKNNPYSLMAGAPAPANSYVGGERESLGAKKESDFIGGKYEAFKINT